MSEVVTEIVALGSAPAAFMLIAAALHTDLARATLPALFALAAGSLVLAYVGAAQGRPLSVVSASVGAAIAGAGLVVAVLTVDSRLAATGMADGGRLALRPSLAIGGARRWRRFERHFWAHVTGVDPDRQSRRKVADTLFAFHRQGRAALFVLLRRDAEGRLLEASAYDPEDYL